MIVPTDPTKIQSLTKREKVSIYAYWVALADAELRKDENLPTSKAAFAALVGVNESTLTRWSQMKSFKESIATIHRTMWTKAAEKADKTIRANFMNRMMTDKKLSAAMYSQYFAIRGWQSEHGGGMREKDMPEDMINFESVPDEYETLLDILDEQE